MTEWGRKLPHFGENLLLFTGYGQTRLVGTVDISLPLPVKDV